MAKFFDYKFLLISCLTVSTFDLIKSRDCGCAAGGEQEVQAPKMARKQPQRKKKRATAKHILNFKNLVTKYDDNELKAFEAEVKESNLPVVVDFYSKTCGPCKSLKPALKEVAEQYEGKIKFIKINTSNFPKLKKQEGISGVPHIKYFKNGKQVGQHRGAGDKKRRKQKICRT